MKTKCQFISQGWSIHNLIINLYVTWLLTTFEVILFCVCVCSDAVQIVEMNETFYAQNMRISINTIERHLIYSQSNVKFEYFMGKLHLFTNSIHRIRIIIIIWKTGQCPLFAMQVVSIRPLQIFNWIDYFCPDMQTFIQSNPIFHQSKKEWNKRGKKTFFALVSHFSITKLNTKRNYTT